MKPGQRVVWLVPGWGEDEPPSEFCGVFVRLDDDRQYCWVHFDGEDSAARVRVSDAPGDPRLIEESSVAAP